MAGKAQQQREAHSATVVEEKPTNVIESATARDTMQQTLENLTNVVGNLLEGQERMSKKQDDFNTGQTRMEGVITEVQRKVVNLDSATTTIQKDLVDLDAHIERVEAKQVEPKVKKEPKVEKEEPTAEKVKEEAKETVKDAGNIFARAAKRVGREVRPSKPQPEQISAVIKTNLTEYGALVACGQLWPVGTLNTIARVLFIA